MEIKKHFINFAVWGCIALILIFSIVFLIAIQGDRNDVRPVSTEHTNYSIFTNTTDSDLIFDQWVRPNEKMTQMPFIFFYRDGSVSKTNGVDRSVIFGKWTKLTENEYFIRWTRERKDNLDIIDWPDSISETIIYNSSKDGFIESSGFYIRYNVRMDNNLSYNK